jgi:hypothetical protein
MKFQQIVHRSQYFWADLRQISHKSACFSVVRGCYSCLELVHSIFTPVLQFQGGKNKYFAFVTLIQFIFSAILTCISGFVVQHHCGRQPEVLW